LHDVLTAHDLAQGLGTQLGGSPLLLGSLPSPEQKQRCRMTHPDLTLILEDQLSLDQSGQKASHPIAPAARTSSE